LEENFTTIAPQMARLTTYLGVRLESLPKEITLAPDGDIASAHLKKKPRKTFKENIIIVKWK
jgi:hypothetical protein